MRILPVGGPPPWSYADSNGLKKPRGPLTREEVIHRIRRFERDSLIIIGMRLLWYVWRHPEVLEEGREGWIGHRITHLQAERLIALAATYASTHFRPKARAIDFRLLCWELNSIEEESFLRPENMSEAIERLMRVKADSPLRQLGEENGRQLVAAAFKARLVSEQHLGRYWDRGSLIRALLIALEFHKLAVLAGGSAYEAAERRFFLASMEDFFRASWVLYAKASMGANVEVMGPHGPTYEHDDGYIDMRDRAEEEEVFAQMGLTANAIRAAANRLSIPVDRARDLKAERGGSEQASLEVDSADWLGIWPLLDLQQGSGCEYLIAPSPWRLATAPGDRMLYGFMEFLDQQNVLGGKTAYSVRGVAFENYLRRALRGVPWLHDLDTFEELPGLRPDVIWLGEEYGVIAEAKFSLKPNVDRVLKSVSAAVAAWERAAEPIQQASGFLRTGARWLSTKMELPKKWVLVTVTNEPNVEEALGFKALAKAGKFLDGTGLEAMALLSPSDFESWAFSSNADSLARRVIEVWSALDPYHLEQELRVDRPDTDVPLRLPHIEAAWKAFFPGASAWE